MKIKMFKKLFLLSLIFCSKAFANDTTGTMSAGGISFAKTQAIKMESEELTISPVLIKVDYLFKNLTDRDITTTVIFPLPPLDQWTNDYTRIDSNKPFANFSVIVNGHPVKFQLKEQALMDGKNITSVLKQAGIPLELTFAGSDDMFHFEGDEGYVLPLAKYKPGILKAKQWGLLNKNGAPRWQVKAYYYWTQTFPARETIKISHEYKPYAGHCLDIMQKQPTMLTDSVSANDCDGEAHVFQNAKALNNWLTNLKTNDNNAYANVKYILTTGSNWAGPIENFTLNLHYPGEILYNQFYGIGNIAKMTKRPGFTQIKLTQFSPKQNLNILFWVEH